MRGSLTELKGRRDGSEKERLREKGETLLRV